MGIAEGTIKSGDLNYEKELCLNVLNTSSTGPVNDFIMNVSGICLCKYLYKLHINHNDKK